MITVLVHYRVKPEHEQELKRLCHESGERQSKYPGFLSRQVWVSMDDPLRITTVTSWRSNADRDAWWNDPKRTANKRDESYLYTRPDEAEWWEVLEGQTFLGPTG